MFSEKQCAEFASHSLGAGIALRAFSQALALFPNGRQVLLGVYRGVYSISPEGRQR
jgi:hypothetical protein